MEGPKKRNLVLYLMTMAYGCIARRPKSTIPHQSTSAGEGELPQEEGRERVAESRRSGVCFD